MAETIKEESIRPRRNAAAGVAVGVGIAAASGAVVFFSWLAEEVFEGDSQALDNAIREFVHAWAADWLTVAAQVLSFMGSTLFLTPAAILSIAVCILMNRRRSGVLLAVVMGGAIILNYVLKTSFVRSRPAPYFDTRLPASFSFPSGHALFSACFYGMLAWIIASRLENRAYRSAVWAGAAGLAFLIGLSRIYLGVHYPTDVIAGYTAAFVWVSTVILANTVLDRTQA